MVKNAATYLGGDWIIKRARLQAKDRKRAFLQIGLAKIRNGPGQP